MATNEQTHHDEAVAEGRLRYHKLAEALLSSDNPTKAIAEMIGDHEGRLDAIAHTVRHLECVIDGGSAK